MKCRRCGHEGETREFRKATGRKGGVDNMCHACNRTLAKEWRRKNSERNRRRDRAYYAAHKETVKVASERWRRRNPHYNRERTQVYRERNARRTLDPTLGKRCSACRKLQPLRNFHRNATTPDGRISRCIACERQRTRRRKGPRKRLGFLLERQNHVCGPHDVKPGCGRDLRDVPQAEIHVDHIVPMSKGGTSDISNLQALCARCNIRWGDRMPS